MQRRGVYQIRGFATPKTRPSIPARVHKSRREARGLRPTQKNDHKESDAVERLAMLDIDDVWNDLTATTYATEEIHARRAIILPHCRRCTIPSLVNNRSVTPRPVCR